MKMPLCLRGRSNMLVKWSKDSLILNTYRIVDTLAEGGMAELYVAENVQPAHVSVADTLMLPQVMDNPHQIAPASLVVLKTIRSLFAFDQELIRMFQDEIALMKQIKHPHIVRWLDAGEHDGRSVLVLEYVQGYDLARCMESFRLEGRSLPLHWRIHIMRQILEALHFIHTMSQPGGQPLQLVHRDVSPPNILVGIHGRAKLADFGIAFHQMMSRESSGEDIRGKFSYVAPEMLAGRKVDQRADLFSWGCVLWELCANQRLFWGETPEEILKQVNDKEIPPVRTFDPDFPAALDDLLQCVLQREPEKRYTNAAQLHSALSQAYPMHSWRADAKELRNVLQGFSSLQLPAFFREVSPVPVSNATKATHE
ncbi:MAG TPA: hypothetical protein DCE42_18430 [Myxococcales bacterium]|nr:hypothetical protein [Myxococcales bacterium]